MGKYKSGQSSKEYHSDRCERLRQLYLVGAGGRCVHCGCTDLDVLQFDHINPATKSFTLGKSWTLKPERMVAEMSRRQFVSARIGVHFASTNGECRRLLIVKISDRTRSGVPIFKQWGCRSVRRLDRAGERHLHTGVDTRGRSWLGG